MAASPTRLRKTSSSHGRRPLENELTTEDDFPDDREDNVPLLNLNSTSTNYPNGAKSGYARFDRIRALSSPYLLLTRLRLIILSSVLAFIFLLLALWGSSEYRSKPSGTHIDAVRSDLYIFFHNDLYGTNTTRNASTLSLLEPKTYKDAARACNLLGEKLVDFDTDSLFPEQKEYSKLLKFRKYFESNETFSEKTRYWIDKRRCMASDGVIRHDCGSRLPALCTQGMKVPTWRTLDRSPKWHLTIALGNQQIKGYRDRRAFRFEGIRYANIPRRFAHSVIVKYDSPTTDNKPLDATKFGSQCVQASIQKVDMGKVKGSEDCLFLNIFTPYIPQQPYPVKKNRDRRLKPVMIFIHGGGFLGGSGSDKLYDGANIASRGDIVVVTINYRVGNLGFLALDDDSTLGNWGLGDQVAALNWVKTHIRSFGGDPDRVTLAGESAGAGSIKALLGSEKTRDMFVGAILQSTPTGGGMSTPFTAYLDSKVYAQTSGRAILDAHNCNDVECLRNIDAYTLGAGIQASAIVKDNKYIPYNFFPLDGSAPQYPVLMGIMKDEAAGWIPPVAEKTTQQYLMEAGLPEDTVNKVLKSAAFPRPENTSNPDHDVAVRVATDAMMKCLNYATAVVKDAFTEVWFFEMDRGYFYYEPTPDYCEPQPSSEYPKGDPSSDSYFRCHGADLVITWGNTAFIEYDDRDGRDIAFTQFVIDYWTQFVRTQNPNPDPQFFKLRGHNSTTRFGRWETVQESGNMRYLDYNSHDGPFSEQEQCNELGFPLDFFQKQVPAL